MKRSMIAILIVLLAVSMLFVSCGKKESAPAQTAEAPKAVAEEDFKPVVLKFSVSGQESQFDIKSDTQAICLFRDLVNEKCDGKVKVEIYWGGALASSNEDIVNGLQTGGIDFNLNGHGVYGDYTDAFYPYSIPYLFTSMEQMAAFDDSAEFQKIAEQFEKDLGIKLLTLYETGFRHMTSNKGFVKSPDDMKGLKLRTMSDPYQIAAMKTLGAAVTPVAWGDLFTALQQGLVDAQENPLTLIQTAKLYEVQKYITFTSHNVSASPVTMNLAAWNALPEKYQKIIQEAATESQKFQRKKLAELDQRVLEYLQEHGMEVYQPTQEELAAFQKVVMSSWETIRKDVGAERFDATVEAVQKLAK